MIETIPCKRGSVTIEGDETSLPVVRCSCGEPGGCCDDIVFLVENAAMLSPQIALWARNALVRVHVAHSAVIRNLRDAQEAHVAAEDELKRAASSLRASKERLATAFKKSGVIPA